MSETLRHYDRWSTGYDQHDNPMVGATAFALDRQPLDVAGADVLELGCGTGRHIARLLDAGARSYVGVDGSPGMLAVARDRHDDPRVRLVEADLAAPLPLDAASFDRALIVLVLEHIVDPAPVFAEIARVLRPGGRLRIAEIHPELVAGGTVAHFRDGDREIRFDSVAHPIAVMHAALARAGLAVTATRELIADGELLDRVPRLAKHRGRPVVVDVEASR